MKEQDLFEFISQIVKEELTESKYHSTTKRVDVMGGKHGVKTSGLVFYHASPMRFRHGDLITGGHSGGGGYEHPNVCMTTQPTPHDTIASNIPGWLGYKPKPESSGDKDWFVYQVEPVGKVQYNDGWKEYQASSARVIKNLGKAAAFLQGKDPSQHDPRAGAKEPLRQRDMTLKHADREKQHLAKLDFDPDLDEASKITEPKRNGLSMDQIGLVRDGGVKNITTVYNQATPEEKEYWGRWYHNAKSDVEILATQFSLPFPVMAAVVAVLSPGNKWNGNLLAAEKLMLGSEKINAYPRQVIKAREILRTGNTKLVSGPKVTVFFQSLMDPRAVEKDMVLDGHAINIWRGEKENLKGLKNPNTTDRAQMVADYQTAAKELGVPVQSLQATTWYIWKYTGRTAPLEVPRGRYDVSRFIGIPPANDNAQPEKSVQGKFSFAEVNAIGSGAVGSSGGLPLGVDTKPGKKLMWSGDKSLNESSHEEMRRDNYDYYLECRSIFDQFDPIRVQSFCDELKLEFPIKKFENALRLQTGLFAGVTGWYDVLDRMLDLSDDNGIKSYIDKARARKERIRPSVVVLLLLKCLGQELPFFSYEEPGADTESDR